jgi:hypothetical protein
MQELFSGVRLAHGESYFLMISRLADGETPRQQQVRNDLRALYSLEAHTANAEAHLRTQGGQLYTLLCDRKSLST